MQWETAATLRVDEVVQEKKDTESKEKKGNPNKRNGAILSRLGGPFSMQETKAKTKKEAKGNGTVDQPETAQERRCGQSMAAIRRRRRSTLFDQETTTTTTTTAKTTGNRSASLRSTRRSPFHDRRGHATPS